jgi:hypothetical protein
MLDFDFIRTEYSKRKPDGSIRIIGPLLDELDKLQSGQVLYLESKGGKKFGVMLWDDMPVASSAEDKP